MSQTLEHWVYIVVFPNSCNHKNIYWLTSIFILFKSDINYREESETPESLGP